MWTRPRLPPRRQPTNAPSRRGGPGRASGNVIADESDEHCQLDDRWRITVGNERELAAGETECAGGATPGAGHWPVRNWLFQVLTGPSSRASNSLRADPGVRFVARRRHVDLVATVGDDPRPSAVFSRRLSRARRSLTCPDPATAPASTWDVTAEVRGNEERSSARCWCRCSC